MRQKLTKCIPPWEIASRLAYKRRKAVGVSQKPPRSTFYSLLSRCTKVISGGHQTLIEVDKGSSNDATVHKQADGSVSSLHLFEDLNINLQHLGLVGLNKRDKRALIEFVNRVEPFISGVSNVFKLLCSISCVINIRCLRKGDNAHANVKLACNAAFESLFARLDNTVNAYHGVTTYLKLCAFYGQDVWSLSPTYHTMVNALISDVVFTTEKEIDDLLFLYERIAICDRRIVEYCSKRMSNHFDCFSENQICNFARYLVKTVYAHVDINVIGAQPDYSKQFSNDETTAILDGFNVNSSGFVKCLEVRLPVCLHRYTYFNLIDMGEFYHVFNINSDVRVRFATELWKYLYTLKYGYPIKSLVVLSKLGLGDTKTFGRLIRNIPQTLAFRWPLSLVVECLINVEGAKNEKIYIILAHYISKRISSSFSPHNTTRIFDALRLKRIAVLGLYHKVLRIQGLNDDWLNADQLFSIARYAREMGFSVNKLFDTLQSRGVSNLSPTNAVTALYMMDTLDPSLVKPCVRTLDECCGNTALKFESLMELLKACNKLNMRPSSLQQLCMDALRDINTVEVHVFLELIHLIGVCGPLDNPSLMSKLESFIEANMDQLPLRTTGSVLWSCFSLGMPMGSKYFIALLRRFNRLYDSNYNEDHLLQVLGAAMMRLESHTSEMRQFLRNLENFKDVSWRRSAADIKRIRELEKEANCRTFVSVFPFTVDVEIGVEELQKYLLRAGERHPELRKYDTLSRQVRGYMDDGEDTLYLDLCQDPFVNLISSDGTINQSLTLYHQLRNHIVGKAFLHIVDDGKRHP